MISVMTGGEPRRDVDPVQLRWAGVPRSNAFAPLNVRRGQYEYLNVLCLSDGSRWRLVTFEDLDFVPGFTTDLSLHERHVVQIAVFADNARQVRKRPVVEARSGSNEVKLELI